MLPGNSNTLPEGGIDDDANTPKGHKEDSEVD